MFALGLRQPTARSSDSSSRSRVNGGGGAGRAGVREHPTATAAKAHNAIPIPNQCLRRTCDLRATI